MEEILEMTKEELNRIKVLTLIKERKLSQTLAAKMLGITSRQVRNLLTRIKNEGDKGVISKKRGRLKNHSLPNDLRENVLMLIQNHYRDFGPKLATEYLNNEHQIDLSKETLRKWMIAAHLWFPKQRRKKLHLPRERRRTFGELIQVDGSHHDWFEGRSSPCVLMVFIDDATSTITGMYFSESESLEAYYKTFERHLKAYGIPLSIYGDRCSVLTPRNPKNSKDRTQFQMALKELGCGLVLALSPQAKGRVERVNRTLQDRLVKELRLRGISTITEANEMLEEYRCRHNKLFSKKPSEQMDAHRSLEGICLENVLCIRETRTLSKDFIVQFKNTFYQISSQEGNVPLYKGGKVEIRQLLNGKRIALFDDKEVFMTSLSEVESPMLNEKDILSWTPRKEYRPAVTHPYKRQFFMSKIKEDILLRVV